MGPVPHSEIVVCNKASEKSDFSDDNSGSDADHGQQEGECVDRNRTFETRCFSLSPIY
jgi:hypothetical protein